MVFFSKIKRGFTLLEVVVIVLIVAILAIVAIPYYDNYILVTKKKVASNLARSLGNHLADLVHTGYSFKSMGWKEAVPVIEGTGKVFKVPKNYQVRYTKSTNKRKRVRARYKNQPNTRSDWYYF